MIKLYEHSLWVMERSYVTIRIPTFKVFSSVLFHSLEDKKKSPQVLLHFIVVSEASSSCSSSDGSKGGCHVVWFLQSLSRGGYRVVEGDCCFLTLSYDYFYLIITKIRNELT